MNVLLPTPFLAQLLEVVNAAPRSSTSVAFSAKDLSTCINLVFLFHFHGCSPTSFFEELRRGSTTLFGLHPDFADAEPVWKRFIAALSHDGSLENFEESWGQAQVFDTRITDAQLALCRQAVRLFFHNTMSYVSLDDNHHPARSECWYLAEAQPS